MLVGYAEAIGHHGELVQGLFEDANAGFRRALVSLPCPQLKAKATFRADGRDGVVVVPSFCEKARRAAELTLQLFNPHKTGGTLSIDSNIAIGRGMGSSTADVLASILAVMDWLGIRAPADKVMRIAIDAETACDSTLFSQQAVLFAHRDGVVMEAFRRMLPPLSIVSVDTMPGATVDTLQFDPARYDQREIETFRPIRSLLRRAIESADSRLLGRVATASARINERFLPKPRFNEIEAIGARFGAAGIQVAHSGTVAGLIFDRLDDETPANIARAAKALSRSGLEPTIFHSLRPRQEIGSMPEHKLMRSLADFENPRIVPLQEGLFGASFFLMKLLPARFMLERAAERRLLTPGATICESSSGTFGLALAMLAAQYGYRLTLVSDWALDRNLHRRLIELGAEITIVDKPATRGGLQQARLDRLAVHLQETPGSYWPCQYDNPDNPLAYAKVAELLINRIGSIDCLVGPVGSGGSMSGTSHYLRSVFPDLHTIGVDTPNSVLFGQPGGRIELSGLGGYIVPGNIDHTQFNEIHWLTPAEAYSATHELHRRHGLFLGPTSGSAYRVGEWWARRNPGKRVVTFFPDEGHRYVETVYDQKWLQTVAGWSSPMRKEPVVVSAPSEPMPGWSRFSWNRRSLQEVIGRSEAAQI